MSSSHGSPYVTVEDFNPLHDPDTRAVVFSFLGAGQGAFVKTVSKACKADYERVKPHETVVWHFDVCEDEAIECTHTTILLSAALASPSKVETGFARRVGAATIGKFVDYDTLLVAQAKLDDFELDGYTLAGAAASGDVQKMMRLHTEKGCELGNSNANALTWAAKGGSVEAMRWLRQQGCQYDLIEVHAAAAYNGHLNVLQFLHEDGCTVPDPPHASATTCCEHAASRGHINVLRWLHKHGWPYGEVCAYAANGGSVPVMQYLKEQGLVFNEETMSNAAAACHLHMCQYLRSVGCPWDAAACTAATAAVRSRSNLEVLRWLHESGCPWDVEAVNVAASTGLRSMEIIQCLWAEGAVPEAAVLTTMLRNLRARKAFFTAQWLQEQGAQWPLVILAGFRLCTCSRGAALLESAVVLSNRFSSLTS
eukprot:3098-Heterococcus_DN1.PRE.2